MKHSWQDIFASTNAVQHNFDTTPYEITAEQIKRIVPFGAKQGVKAIDGFCYHPTRESRPRIFREKGLFLLPIQDGAYVIVKGEGYVDIPKIGATTPYASQLDFDLDTIKVGNSEMKYVDYAYATSLIRTFLEDDSLVLTIRGRENTPDFEFRVGRHSIRVQSVQTEVDAGYEGRNTVALISAKRMNTNNTIIRQLFYPYRQWQSFTKKRVIPVFFEKSGENYRLWEFEFADENDYNSIRLVKAGQFFLTNKRNKDIGE